MNIPINKFKSDLHDGRPLFGLWTSLSGSYAIEVVSGAGFDWLMIDTEHSPNDLETVLNTLQIIAAYPSHPVIRVPWNDMVTIKRFLDIGVQTLLIPQINTAEEARAAVAYTRYPPSGLRGVGGTTRATRFGRVDYYAKKAQQEICILVQVESAIALENLEEIASVDGVDGVFVGPADLHASLGYAGETRNPEVMSMMESSFKKISKLGKAAGTILTGSAEDGERWINSGVRFLAVASDLGILARGTDGAVKQWKNYSSR